ncbi:hypothetical protein B0T18DRAFT_152282 [Schizothecium vesticola]|uniref:Uncharacterized protein n=1 Tax=Schizothecium vesticola TaxID=314040 RepID=A0AA40K594_9PEZI|nr:hypothetical protein B0T18DRAFT_152282 [Schizothecium vesticola]
MWLWRSSTVSCMQLSAWKLAPTLFGLFRGWIIQGVWFVRKMAMLSWFARCDKDSWLVSWIGDATRCRRGEERNRHGEGLHCVPAQKSMSLTMVGIMITPPLLSQLWPHGEGCLDQESPVAVSEKRSIVGSNHGNTVGTAATRVCGRDAVTSISALGPPNHIGLFQRHRDLGGSWRNLKKNISD